VWFLFLYNKDMNTPNEIDKNSIPYFIINSDNYQNLKNELQCAVRTSYTGITNLVVNYEDPLIVDEFLNECFPIDTLYRGTINIDAVELQQDSAGSGICLRYLDQLIYGTFKEENEGDVPFFKTDSRTGKRERLQNGFVNRKEVISGKFKDKTLIIRNIDAASDFCTDEVGLISQKSLYIFDNFRNPIIKGKCNILLVTNKRLILPFKIRVVEFNPINKFEAEFLINSIIDLYDTNKYTISFTKNQKEQLIRKVSGLTYTNAGDAIIHSVSQSESPKGSKIINPNIVLKKIRERINKNYMEDGFGLTQLTSRPWEDYICPESSNFTFDVYKILRDFKEIESLRKLSEERVLKKEDETEYENLIEAIRNRIPHVIVIYGKGGLGKCLGRGTPVIMFDRSIKNVEDVKVDDLLMGPDSKPRTVLTTITGIGQLYRVEQKNGDDYVCNNAHMLSLQNAQKSSDRSPIFISAEDFYKKDKHYKKYNNGWKVGINFPVQKISIDPYWMGLWLGDGTSRKPAITIGNKDPEISNWLEEWAKSNNLFIRKEKYADRACETWNFAYRQGRGSGHIPNFVTRELRRLNLLQNKHIPEIYWKNSSKNRLELLAGLIDSDGYMTKDGSLQFSNTNEKLAKQVLYLVRSLGFKGFWSQSIKGIKSIGYKVMSYTVTIGGKLSKIPTRLPRKQGHDNPQKKTLKCGIIVNPIGDGEYFGFTIDGDHQFLLGDFTVTHNSAMPIHLAGLLDFDVWDFNINAVHSKWVGEGSKQMRESLKRITNSSHLIIRVDEYDRAIGSTGESGSGMHEAHKQVECEFMNWLQNSQEENLFVKNNIIVVLTTNHKENITGPLLRSGRSDLVIDIDNFDAKSIKETLLTSARRIKNRGIKIIGFNEEELQNKINELDLDKISSIATIRGFTVRDIETLIMEMSAHNYYYTKTNGKEGLVWNTDNFYNVLENSEGSIKENGTGELVLGDRVLLKKRNIEENKNEEQLELFKEDLIIRGKKMNEIDGFKKV